ncbi:MAG: hypothetical protein ACRCZI_15345 [Cetobacterium sp.]
MSEMKRGRPKGGAKPLSLKLAQGDTRKLGARKFAEACASAVFGRRGAPPDPAEFDSQDLPEELVGIPEAEARHAATEKRRWRAKQHWEYLCSVLASEELLCEMDQGLLAGMCWDYALMTEAAEAGSVKEYALLRAAYTSGTDRCGLSEVARTKLSKPPKPELSAMDAALAAGLPEDGEQPIQ